MSVTHRVNSTMLPEYKGKTVRLLGKVLKLEGETATLEACDNGQVTIKLNRDSNFSDSYVEVIGKVTPDGAIQEFTSYNMGEHIDMKAVEAVVQAGVKYPELFTAAKMEDGY